MLSDDTMRYMADARAARANPPGSTTTPISFRVSQEALDQLKAAGKSPVEIARTAIEREARLAKKMLLVERLRAKGKGTTPRAESDTIEFIRRERERM